MFGGRNFAILMATFATMQCVECFKLRASPVDIPGLSVYKESISTNCVPPNCDTRTVSGRINKSEGDLPTNVIHTTTTNCAGSDCATQTLTPATPASKKKALKERLVELERLVEEKEERDLANVTLTSMTKEAKKAVNHYHATLLRSAAQQIRERTSPEQMVLSNISQLLVGLTINKTMPIEAKVAKPIVQNEAIDLTKLILPDVEKEDPPTLEERIDGMEQWVTKKLHGRMDAIEEKMGDKKVLTSDEKKLKIKQLNEDIKKELIKKMDKLEHDRRKEMMAKIKALQKTIEHGGVETSKEEEASGSDENKDDNGGKDVDAGAAGGDASGAASGANDANEEVLDGDNGEKIYTLSGDEADEEGEEEQDGGGNGGCADDGETSLIELQQRQKLGLPPCPTAGENGMNDVSNPSLYEGGPPNVAPLQPQKFYKATEVEAGSIDGAEIMATTDLDDPPPKTQAPQDMLPLSQIVQGSNAPKTEIVSSGTTESALEYN